MPKMGYSREIRDVLDSFLLENPDVEPGKAFGMPAYYINGKMFAGVYEDGATIKVPEETAAELLERDGFEEFRPMDRHTMKNWVVIKREDPREYVKDRELFEDAMGYVLLLSKTQKKKKK